MSLSSLYVPTVIWLTIVLHALYTMLRRRSVSLKQKKRPSARPRRPRRTSQSRPQRYVQLCKAHVHYYKDVIDRLTHCSILYQAGKKARRGLVKACKKANLYDPEVCACRFLYLTTMLIIHLSHFYSLHLSLLSLLTPQPPSPPQNPALSDEAAGKAVLSLLDMELLKSMTTEEYVCRSTSSRFTQFCSIRSMHHL